MKQGHTFIWDGIFSVSVELMCSLICIQLIMRGHRAACKRMKGSGIWATCGPPLSNVANAFRNYWIIKQVRLQRQQSLVHWSVNSQASCRGSGGAYGLHLLFVFALNFLHEQSQTQNPGHKIPVGNWDTCTHTERLLYCSWLSSKVVLHPFSLLASLVCFILFYFFFSRFFRIFLRLFLKVETLRFAFCFSS